MPEHGFGQERDVTEPANVPLVDGKTFWTPEIAVNKRRVKLQSEVIVNSVADDELRDQTFQSLPGGIGNFAIVELRRAEISELLGDGGVEPGQGNFLLRHRFQLRGVAAAKIASARGQRKKCQCDNEQPTQHPVCSTQGGRSRQLAGVAASLRDAWARLIEPRLQGLTGNSGVPCEARLHLNNRRSDHVEIPTHAIFVCSYFFWGAERVASSGAGIRPYGSASRSGVRKGCRSRPEQCFRQSFRNRRAQRRNHRGLEKERRQRGI